LRDVQPVPEVGGELRTAECLGETAPVVVVHLRFVNPGALDPEWLHGKTLSTPRNESARLLEGSRADYTGITRRIQNFDRSQRT
jgi:hypothetical protein